MGPIFTSPSPAGWFSHRFADGLELGLSEGSVCGKARTSFRWVSSFASPANSFLIFIPSWQTWRSYFFPSPSLP